MEKLLTVIDDALRTLYGSPISERSYTSVHTTEDINFLSQNQLSIKDKKISGAMMRVNHSGEVCAQALYLAQAITCRSGYVRQHMLSSKKEEWDHLAWTNQRLRELGASRSKLNPIWYSSSFVLAFIIGSLDDKLSLGFITEIEYQVENHLKNHISQLPRNDLISKFILIKMLQDEKEHGLNAKNLGGSPIPKNLKTVMRIMGKIMIKFSYAI